MSVLIYTKTAHTQPQETTTTTTHRLTNEGKQNLCRNGGDTQINIIIWKIYEETSTHSADTERAPLLLLLLWEVAVT